MEVLDLRQVDVNQALQKAASVLAAGGLVVYPTETTYGIGADATSQTAIDKLLKYKSKRDGKPLSIAVTNQKMAEQYVLLNQTAVSAYKTYLPGPVTVISSSLGKVATGVDPTKTIGIRIPKYDLALKLIEKFGKGITATGANASGERRPYSIADILDHTTEKQQSLIDLILDVGELEHNEPSTVIDTTLDDIVVERQGLVNLGKTQIFDSQSSEETMVIGEKLAKQFRSFYTTTPVIFLLTGEMGAGKTHLTKGIARGLGVSSRITSPTYSLMHEYEFRSEGEDCKLLHIDLWRLASVEQMQGLDIEKLANPKNLLVIEWADRFAYQLENMDAKLVHISSEIIDENKRRIYVDTRN